MVEGKKNSKVNSKFIRVRKRVRWQVRENKMMVLVVKRGLFALQHERFFNTRISPHFLCYCLFLLLSFLFFFLIVDHCLYVSTSTIHLTKPPQNLERRTEKSIAVTTGNTKSQHYIHVAVGSS